MSEKPLTHIVGTFLIQAEGAFLNGSTQEDYGKFKITPPKTLKEFNNKIPYVSAQAWRRWLRDTFVDEYGDPTTPIETTGIDSGETKETFTTKKVGAAIDPVKYAEHDIFGYMNSKEGQGKGGVKATIRSSPFQSSILLSVRKSGWEGIDEGFVHPKSVAISLYREILDELLDEKSQLDSGNKKQIEEIKKILDKDISRSDLVSELEKELRKLKVEKGKDKVELAIRQIVGVVPTPLPYTTRFYNSQLQGVFGLALHRLGLFRNAGDREELEEILVEKYLKEGAIEEIPNSDKSIKAYQLKNKGTRIIRAERVLRSLARLRGGAKQAQFGTDVSPKVIIIAGLSCGNLIFNDLFEDTKELVTNPREQFKDNSNEIVESQVIGGVRLKLDTLKQIIWDYRDRLKTPVFIGVRKGYLSKSSESELNKWISLNEKKWADYSSQAGESDKKTDEPEVELCSPIEATEKLLFKLNELEKM